MIAESAEFFDREIEIPSGPKIRFFLSVTKLDCQVTKLDSRGTKLLCQEYSLFKRYISIGHDFSHFG